MSGLSLQDARAVAARIAARAEIRDVRLMATSAELNQMPAGPHLTYKIEKDIKIEYEDGDEHFVVVMQYSLMIAEVEHDPEKGQPRVKVNEEDLIAKVDFTLAGLFELSMREGDAPPTEDELIAYAGSMGVFALHPYSREYVHDVTGRLGLPPLTIGVLQLDYDPDRG